MAGWLLKSLGYGVTALIDPDNPDNPPSVTAAITAPDYEEFTRILQGQFNNDEEVRMEKPDSYSGSFEYVGVAPIGTPTTSPVWKCVRCTWSMNKKVRMQYMDNVAWDERATANW